MANSVSAKKRIRQNIKSRARNRWVKTAYREKIKDYRETILHGSVEEAESQLSAIYKELDQAASTPALHKNTASRYKSRLAAKLNEKKTAAS
jgi:small subunit ribosomal protein S20